MNKMIFIVPVVTSTVSGIVGFFIGRKVEKKKATKNIENELKQLSDYYEDKLTQNNNVNPVVMQEPKPVEAAKTPETGLPQQEVTGNSLNDLLNSYGAALEDQKPTKRGRPKKGVKAAIYEIALEQYGNSEYPAETLIRYANGIFVDGYGTVINDPAAYVGLDGLDKIDTLYSLGDDDQLTTLYFKNDVLGVDYEVELSPETYDGPKDSED